MSEPHVIRLREPWDRIVLADGRIRHRRFFNLPTGLTPTTTVKIVCDSPETATTFWLNDSPYANHFLEQGTWGYEITKHLVARNQVDIDVAAGFIGPDLPWQEVRLEICEG